MFIIKSDIFSVADLVPEKHFRKQAKPQMANIKLDLNIGELPGFGGSDSGPNLQPLYFGILTCQKPSYFEDTAPLLYRFIHLSIAGSSDP